MPDPIPVTIPLLNPNEPEAQVASVLVSNGQRVAAGDLLCTLETTKSTAELTAEVEGYIAGVAFSQGQTARAGELFCYISASPDWQPAAPSPLPTAASQPPPGVRITQPALALAQSHDLDLSQFPAGALITEQHIREKLAHPGASLYSLPDSPFDPTTIIVYGGGGHGKSLIDLLRLLGTYRILGIVDDGMGEGTLVMDVPVLGGAGVLAQLREQGVRLAVNAVGGIGNLAVRIQVFHKLAQAGFSCPALVHPTAFVEPSAKLSPGVQVFPHAYVGSQVQIGYGAIVNTGVIVSHDCLVGDYANLSPGAILAGEVQIGAGTLVGMGVTVNLRVKIGSGCRIGNSATVKSDLADDSLVRAGSVWPG